MQTDNRFLDDLARLASGTLSTLQGAKTEATARFRDQLDRMLHELDVVPREEFEAVRAMAVKAREENEALAARVAALEAALGKSAGRASGTAAKAAPAAKPQRKPAGGRTKGGAAKS